MPDRAEALTLHWLSHCTRILDAGCGDCTWPSRRMGFVAGIDRDGRRIERAKQRGIGGLEVGDVTDMPYLDQSFDAVVARELLEHLPPADLHAFLVEAARVLIPGGLLVATTWERSSPQFWTHVDHVRPYPAKAVLRWIGKRRIPLSLVHFERMSGGIPGFGKLGLEGLTHWMARTWGIRADHGLLVMRRE